MNKVSIIAEAGVNHNGSLDIAKRLAKTAKECGADVVKFQTFKPDKLVCENAPKAAYQKKNDKKSNSQKDMLEKLALSFEQFVVLKKYCEKIGIEFLTTAFDLESLDFVINTLKVKCLKIPSGEITNYPYLVKCAESHLPLIVSTGMCSLKDVKDCIKVLKSNHCGKLSILHCTTQYPAPVESLNLLAIKTLANEFKTEVGYSDHSQGLDASIMSVCLGASIIEKHFTLDKSMDGPDHIASINPEELKELIRKVRDAEKMLGDGNKVVSDAEKQNILVARKSIVAKTDIKKGDKFSEENLTCKRPGDGLNPMLWNKVINRKAKRFYKKDELIEL